MARTIGSVILGYLVMVIVVFATFSLAFQAMGVDRAYQAGTYEVSGLWIVVSIILGIVAAILGGFACARVAHSPAAPRALAAVVLIIGLGMAVAAMAGAGADDRPAVRPAEVSNIEAMRNSRTPIWLQFLNPLIGAAGVLYGAGLARKSKVGGVETA
jgi:lysylphosphatidylglycerol synthetase-like protein (DUF2156 family)